MAVGRSKSIACVSCHGAEGVSSYDTWPTIAGRPEAYLLVQLRAFRDGIRDNPWMSPMAKRLSDGDIEDLAAYFSALPERSDPHD